MTYHVSNFDSSMSVVIICRFSKWSPFVVPPYLGK